MLKLSTHKRTIEIPDNERTGYDARIERQARGLSLRAVAQQMGVSPAYLSDLERGNRAWSQSMVERFTGALMANT